MRRFWGLVFGAAVLMGLAMPAEAQKRANTVRFGYDQVPENVDPYYNSVRIGVILGQQVWDTLIYRDPKTNEYRGQLATAWRWIDDRTLELDLRQGVKFHNGEEFDADDVVFTLNFVSDPANKSVTQQNVSWIQRVEKVDKFKVRIVTRRPFPAAIEYLAGPLVIHPNEYYAQVGPRGMNEKPIGTGPYRVTDHQIGKQITLRRNPDYFRDSPKPQPTIETVVIRFIPDRQTQVAEMLAGGLDFIMNIAPDQAAQMRAVPSLQIVSGETMRIAFLQMATSDQSPTPALRDVRVRRAINHAIDRQTMATQLVGPGSQVLNAICFRSQFGCDDSKTTQYAYDPAKARQLLAEAGFPNGFDLELHSYRERNQAEAMIGYLRAVGIRAALRFGQYAAFREQNRANRVGLAHQTWGSFSVNDTSASTSVFYKGVDDDTTRDPELIALLSRGDTVTDPEQRKAAYRDALARISEQAFSVPLYSLVTFYAAAKDLEFTPYPDELPRFWEMRWK
ncbi:MAG: ABC transporter substrate-binding protein [Phreatobacter sp.]